MAKHKYELKLYTQPNCSLCEEAKRQLEFVDLDITYEEIDIIEDDELMMAYQIRVPVLTYQDKVVQEGIIDFVTVTENLEQY
ncbi:glutaredoxin family protein [Macrococcus brunensis]|uniref:glutaredoxin family protein n=1 Tax=Macrococcus brunensis TaxID=198483 RepID=UPI001EF13FAD|nr:glutaredoxin family protein [Macrococcus brunensis]ULG72557.1 glutaredoxin family protein [Macrococcus brunensis]ULG74811.1 glutaredoxin family protein [Macrococcus brunensis]